MATETKIVDKFSNLRREVMVHETEVLTLEGRLACALIEKWGMVCGVPDGEDSSGRAKMGLMTPRDVVQRAVETSSLAMDAFRASGWTAQLPSIDEINAPPEEDTDSVKA